VSVSQAFPPIGREFEPFLYAVLCDEGNGMPLTVISAIARSGNDPWTEAARIAKLPKAMAVDALARMIPDRGRADGAATADGLYALLPIAGENRIIPMVGARTVARYWSPAVPIIIVLLIALALASAFRKAPSANMGPQDAPSSAPFVDKADR
jgi:hypothetical protein